MEDPAALVICYGFISPGCICIPAGDLLYGNGVQAISVVYKQMDGILKLSLGNTHTEGYTIDFDIFSAAFYLITEYYRYTEQDFDIHGRYKEDTVPFFTEGYHARPVIHNYAVYLLGLLQSRHRGIPAPSRRFSYRISIDIDAPFLYKYKPAWLSWGGLLKDAAKGNIYAVKKRLAVAAGGQDPYDTFGYILSQAGPEKLLFFTLLDRHSGYDERHTYKNSAYRKLIHQLKLRGATIGLHPSYTTFLDQDRIRFEKQRLEDITGNPVRAARMHFLKYRLPDTYRYLLKEGFTDEYSSCMVSNPGFRTGMAIPHPWFDVLDNTSTPMLVHPTMVMDRSLQQYQGLSAAESLQSIKNLIDTTAEAGGEFIILLHNSTLCECGEWKGWRQLFEQMLSYLLQTEKHHEGIPAA